MSMHMQHLRTRLHRHREFSANSNFQQRCKAFSRMDHGWAWMPKACGSHGDIITADRTEPTEPNNRANTIPNRPTECNLDYRLLAKDDAPKRDAALVKELTALCRPRWPVLGTAWSGHSVTPLVPFSV